jgi:hypothetical protein
MEADGAMQEHRQVVSRYVILIDGGAVSWCLKKQELIALLTTKSEYVASTHATKELIWFQCLLKRNLPTTRTPDYSPLG